MMNVNAKISASFMSSYTYMHKRTRNTLTRMWAYDSNQCVSYIMLRYIDANENTTVTVILREEKIRYIVMISLMNIYLFIYCLFICMRT